MAPLVNRVFERFFLSLSDIPPAQLKFEFILCQLLCELTSFDNFWKPIRIFNALSDQFHLIEFRNVLL